MDDVRAFRQAQIGRHEAQPFGLLEHRASRLACHGGVYTIAAVPVRALLFDFDGLILDTETASRAGWQWLYREHGHELPPAKWALMVGTVDGWDIWGHLEELVGEPLDRPSWNERRYAHEVTLLEAEELRPGIADYVAYAQEHDLKRAIVSSASRRWIDMHLERLERAAGWQAKVVRRWPHQFRSFGDAERCCSRRPARRRVRRAGEKSYRASIFRWQLL